MRTSTRLGLSFASVLALFAIASFATLRATELAAHADDAVAAADKAKHAGHRVAALVREQYIHQAHTIIEGNRSHLGHYEDIARRTRAASDELSALAHTNEQREIAAEIASLVRKNDDDFVSMTLPAIERGDRAEVLRLHMETESVVGRATKRVGELNERFEAESDLARTDAQRERGRERWTATLCFAIAILLAACISIATTRSFARKVAVVHAGTRRIGEGELSRTIALKGSDELADLARAIDEMATKLRAHQRELLRSQQLAAIGRLSASVAHEINGPLGIILGYTKIIRTQGLDKEALDAIEAEARHCQRTVAGLLELARNDGLALAEVDLARLAREVVGRLRASGRVEDRAVEIRTQGATLAHADEGKLRQAFLSILTNAIEATSTQGTIQIEIVEKDGRVHVVTQDDGAGFDAEAKAHMFEPFFTTKAQGHGLGLALAHAVVEAHHGELRVESEKGRTRVEIDIPVEAS